MTMKTLRELINLLESIEQGAPLTEGIMDRIKNIYRGLLYDGDPMTDEEFLTAWQRTIQSELGRDVSIDTLAGLQQEFRKKYRDLARRGEAPRWDQEMGGRVAEGKIIESADRDSYRPGYIPGVRDPEDGSDL